MSEKSAFYSASKFWAAEYFPRGIGRSGHFTKDQARLLEAHGRAYQALAEGSREPANSEEEQFVLTFKGEKEVESPHEKTWYRFLQVTHQKHRMHYSASSSTPSVDFSAHSEDGDI